MVPVLILLDHFTVTVLIAGTGHYVNMVGCIYQYNFLANYIKYVTIFLY